MKLCTQQDRVPVMMIKRIKIVIEPTPGLILAIDGPLFKSRITQSIPAKSNDHRNQKLTESVTFNPGYQLINADAG